MRPLLVLQPIPDALELQWRAVRIVGEATLVSAVARDVFQDQILRDLDIGFV
jgi:hypothetical protein